MRMLAIVVGLAVTGCGREPANADKFDAILAQLEKFKTEMCACKDTACVSRVAEARREYKRTMRDRLDKDARPTAAQDQKGKAVEAELQACRKKLTAAESDSAEEHPENPEKGPGD